VIIVAIDGVRWQDVFLGVEPELAEDQGLDRDMRLPPERLIPNIHQRVIGQGAAIGAPNCGAPMTVLNRDYVSLPGYLEMLTGQATHCTTNDCGATTIPTIAEAFRDELRVAPGRIGFISSWDRLERAAAADPRGIIVSAGRTRGHNHDLLRGSATLSELLDMGAVVGPFPGGGNYRPDAYTANLALHYLIEHRPRFLFVGLGDTDEWGHKDDYENYLQALRFADTFVGSLLTTLETMGPYGHGVTVIVTTDHGRAEDFKDHGGKPEAARVWLGAVGAGVPRAGLLTSPTERHLADLVPTIRALMGLPAIAGDRRGTVLAELVEAGERQELHASHRPSGMTLAP